VAETGDETPADSEEPAETTDEATAVPDTTTADTSTDTGDTSATESPAESEESTEPADSSDETDGEMDEASEEAEPAESEEANTTEDSAADAETTEDSAADTEATEADAADATAETPETTTEETAETTTASTGPTITYVVRPGDNLFLIGLPYGLQWTEIAAVNDLDDPNDLEVGQEIVIPATSVVMQPPPAVPSGPTTHRVQAGENLFRIALAYNMDYITLARANNIGWPYTIYAGQTLTIPGR
jgi:LysM repeat protein